MNQEMECVKEIYNTECYKDKLKYEKRKLHHKYTIGILIVIIILLIVQTTFSFPGFVSKMNFTSTITSIILSVIAIIISINGEAKSESVQNNLISSSSKLEKWC
ncbi:MAG: hypothetical protein K0R46_3473 [Herbinix sp.]|nr:hypothetical protein [Herbinix sp.]